MAATLIMGATADTLTTIYSFVVDGGEPFEAQAQIFCRTLLATSVAPETIYAQLTPAARRNERLVETLRSFAIHLVEIAPFLDGQYCNKLAQFENLPWAQAEFVALCDTDLAFLENVEALARPGVVRAKPVDHPNPPLELLAEARRRCGVTAEPRLTRTSLGGHPTFAGNCNGGLYILPVREAQRLAPRWRALASQLFADREFLGRFAKHIDQISFAMAMLDLGLELDEVPIAYNFPLHLVDELDPAQPCSPKIIHYHRLHDGARALHRCDRPDIAAAIDAVNAVLAPPR